MHSQFVSTNPPDVVLLAQHAGDIVGCLRDVFAGAHYVGVAGQFAGSRRTSRRAGSPAAPAAQGASTAAVAVNPCCSAWIASETPLQVALEVVSFSRSRCLHLKFRLRRKLSAAQARRSRA